MPFEKGHDPNRNYKGRPKGSVSITAEIKKQLATIPPGQKNTYLELVVKKIFQKALVDGDTNMLKEIWHYVNGMPEQKIETKNWFAILNNVYDLPTAPETQLPEDTKTDKLGTKQVAEDSGKGSEPIQDDSSGEKKR